ncbi:cell division protein FtsX [Chromatiales bacterium (ex Bugula neritina AB1)]|nr:cell division protein FtsX [Chromatiales bacterium (ex Bugula neritina AB1)]
MLQPFELFVGLRYTRAKRRNHFISFISLISILGIALGVTALITVMAVMNGFEKELRERILGAASHATITLFEEPMQRWQELADAAIEHPQVVGAAPYVEGQVMVVKGKQVTGIVVRGVLPEEEPAVSDISEKMSDGELADLTSGSFEIVLGSALATFLGADVGDKITVITPESSVTPVGVLPRMKRFTVSGIFEIGMFEYDRNFALMHADDASVLMKLNKGYTGVRLRLNDMFAARLVAGDLAKEVGEQYWVSDWTQRHANFFRAVKTEKTVMFVILSLIVAVAAFNIVSTLVMVVTDKQSAIAILRTMGASPKSIMLIFLIQGALIGLVGMVLGVIGGILLATNVETLVPAIERLFQTQFLDASVYYINVLPSELDYNDVWRVASLAVVLTLLATLYPAWVAARTEPARALAYE